MNLTRIFIILIVSIVTVSVYLQGKLTSIQSRDSVMSESVCIPAFPDGDGPYYVPGIPTRETLSPATASGQRLVVSGKILRRDCKTPAAGVVLDIWHADEHGSYTRDWYRGKVITDKNGSYKFTTVIPKGYGEGTGYRPPHIHFKVWENNSLLVTSEMFFPDVKGKPDFNDAYIMELNPKGQGKHDIILP